MLKKRICSFRPTSSVRAMLAECEALISALGMSMSLEDVINAALESYLPPLILNLRDRAQAERERIFEKAERVIRGETVSESSD